MKQAQGFSLVELIIVIVVLSVLAAIIAPVLQAGFKSYLTHRNLIDADWQGRTALLRMERDLRDLPSSKNIIVANPNQLAFLDKNNVTVAYTLNNTHILRNGYILAEGLSSLMFNYYDQTGLPSTSIADINYISTTLSITHNGVDTLLKTVFNLRDLLS